MPGHTRSRTVAVLFASLLSLLLPLTAAAQIRFDLPAQPLAQALTTVGSLANINIYFDPATVDGLQSPALKAELTPNDALTRLLAGTRLHAVRVDDNTFRVVMQGESKRAQEARTPATGQAYPGPPPGSSANVHLASAATVGADDSRAATSDATNRVRTANALEEVIVSAEKRDERLQDVPVPVTAISAQALSENAQPRIQDYYTQIPGFNVAPQSSSSFQLLSIRGISTGIGNNPTVGITVDDVPYGSSTYLGGGGYVPDIDPAELARIEVLRGPQGTLYGASSMGGLLKFVTIDPSTDKASGRVELGTDRVHNGADWGYNARASGNMPINDELAVRASAFVRRDPGYIDNVETGRQGVNEQRVYGGRLSALWTPAEHVSLKLSALYQDTKGDGFSDVDKPTDGFALPPLGDLQQSYLRGTGNFERKVQAYSATLRARLGALELVAISAYNVNSFSDTYDYTYLLGDCCTLPQFGVTGTPVPESNRTNKFTEEVRLSGAAGANLDWLLGLFYTHESSPYSYSILAEDPANGQIVGQWLYTSGPTKYIEYAAFGDLTYHFTDQFDVQIGARESEIKQTFSDTYVGPYDEFFLGLTSPVSFPEVDAKANAFTYLFTPRFKFSNDLMLYARLASGYRAGGPNVTPGVPRQSDPDRTQTYEFGLKGDLLEHRLGFDVSAYYIDWRRIQIQVLDQQNGQYYSANGNRAKSQGLEVSVESKPLAGLTLGAWVAWDDAELTESFPPTGSALGVPGDRLPYSSRFSGSFSLQEEFPITEQLSGFAGGTVSYVGDRKGEFASAASGSSLRQDLPGYAKADFRVGAKYGTWTGNLFVNNAADKRGVLSGGLGTFPPFSFTYIQPRTVGLTITKAF